MITEKLIRKIEKNSLEYQVNLRLSIKTERSQLNLFFVLSR